MERDMFAGGVLSKCTARVDRTKYCYVSGVVILSVYGIPFAYRLWKQPQTWTCSGQYGTGSLSEVSVRWWQSVIKMFLFRDEGQQVCEVSVVESLARSTWTWTVCVLVHPVLQLELCHLLLLGAVPSEKWLSVSRPWMGKQHQPLTHWTHTETHNCNWFACTWLHISRPCEQTDGHTWECH